MKLILKMAVVIGALAVLASATGAEAVAASGSQDLTFGNSGVATAPGTQEGDGIRGLTVQPSGKIVAIGYWATPSYSHGWNFHAARYNSDGALDTTFGNAGIYDHDISGRHDVPRGYAVQSDGKIILGGDIEYNTSANYRATLTRITPNGTLDTTFAENGVWIDSRGIRSNLLRLVALPNDKLLITGRDGDYGRAWILRLFADGSIDNSFGSGGYVYFNDNGGEKLGVGVLVDSFGKAVVAGVSGSLAWIYRLNSNGSLDSTFGSGGEKTYTLTGSELGINSVLKSTNGYIVTGSIRNGTTGKKNILLLKINQNGTLATSFGTAGLSIVTPSDTAEITGLASAIDSKGIIYIAGVRDDSGTTVGSLTAIGPDGRLIIQFGNNGFTSGQASFYESLALQEDGKVLTGGQINGSFAVERFAGAKLPKQPGGLAATGFDSLGTLGFGLLIIALGAYLTIFSRRHTKH